MVQSKDLGALSTPPQPQPGSTPHNFASRLNDFFRGQQQCGRIYKDKEQAMMYLQGMTRESTYTAATQQLMYELQPFPDHGTLPTRFSYPTIAMTLLTHPMALRTTTTPTPQSATINVTKTHYAPTETSRPSDPASYKTDRGRSTSAERRRRPEGYGRPPPRMASKQLDIQCKACATHGHSMKDCKFFPRVVAACIEYINNNPDDTKETLTRYRKMMHPDAKKAAKDSYLKVLQSSCLPDNTDLEDLADQLINASSWNDGNEDYSVSICQMAHTQQSILGSDCMEYCQPTSCTWKSMLSTEIQPVKLPDQKMMRMLPPDMAHIVTQPLPMDMTVAAPQETDPSTPTLQLHTIGKCARMDTRRDLADTGASVSATGRLEILHHFTPHTPYEIMGYDGTITRAAGQGIAYIKNPDKAEMDEMFFVYVPSIDGTIISLEHHTRTHPEIHTWAQEAVSTTDTGWVTFRDENDVVISRYQTKQEKGLYYIQDLDFHHVESVHIAMTHLQHTQETNTDDTTVKTGTPKGQPINCIDFEYNLGEMNMADQMLLVSEWQEPPTTSLIARIQIQSATHTEKDIMNFETWHQRLAHCSEKRLRQTQKRVDGIPAFHTSKIPTLVRCRTCDVAKLKKAPRGQTVDDSDIILKGQVFQMDIWLIRGPTNLQAVLDRVADVESKVIESRNGFVCYLLIVDRKSRYMWPFPLKSKSVPSDLIKPFLTTHGHPTCSNRIIKSNGEGSIAESQTCPTMLAKLGYTLQKTATDSSSQNGVAERPHQTLGAMVRCLLYSASMPVTFWADALVYATYINNRLYHSGICAIPYTEWTDRRADLRHLRAFGAHVSVRRSGSRPTKTDPHYFDGRFLRFAGTTKNIVYFDTTTKRDKTARHCAMDEFHYGTPACNRPTGAQSLLDRVIPNHTLPSDKPDAPANTHTLEFLDTSHHLPPLALDSVTDTSEHTVTATAAQLLTEADQNEILHLDISFDMYSTPTVLNIPINRLPTLSFILSETPMTNQVFVKNFQEGTAVSRMHRWRSLIRNSVVRSVNNKPVKTIQDFIDHVAQARRTHDAKVEIRFAKPAVNTSEDTDILQLHFDQLCHLNQLHIELHNPIDETQDACLNYTRTQLRKREDYQEWRATEWSQLDKYELQDMFGAPIPRPYFEAIILPFVWTYLMKEDPITGLLRRKSRATCNGGKKYGKAVTVAETYATCVEQPACRVYWAMTAQLCLIAMGADAGNAFAEAPPPSHGTILYAHR